MLSHFQISSTRFARKSVQRKSAVSYTHLRENAVKTFEYFKSQGVAIKVISGDNPRTVSRIAIQAGIESAESLSLIHI